jgi:hypothetical protein
MKVLLAFALTLGLGYLVARPHVGTVWNETVRLMKADGTETKTGAMRQFPAYRDCAEQRKTDNDAEVQMDAATPGQPTALYECQGQTRLLWGW